MSTPRSYGRDIAADRRDRKYRMRAPRSFRQSRFWRTGPWADDQGAKPRCVGSAWSHWLASSPIRQWLDPQGIYELAQHLDEWEGSDYEGTSVRAGAKVLAMLGAIGEYRWAWDADDLAAHVLEVGPAVVGTNWLEGMEEPDDRDTIHAEGELLGGHAYLVCGYTRHTDRFKLKQSWGDDWGRRGFAWISRADLNLLIEDDGEACTGVELTLKAA